jgi:hypothetical protein
MRYFPGVGPFVIILAGCSVSSWQFCISSINFLLLWYPGVNNCLHKLNIALIIPALYVRGWLTEKFRDFSQSQKYLKINHNFLFSRCFKSVVHNYPPMQCFITFAV